MTSDVGAIKIEKKVLGIFTTVLSPGSRPSLLELCASFRRTMLSPCRLAFHGPNRIVAVILFVVVLGVSHLPVGLASLSLFRPPLVSRRRRRRVFLPPPNARSVFSGFSFFGQQNQGYDIMVYNKSWSAN